MEYSSLFKGFRSVMDVSEQEDIDNRLISKANWQIFTFFYVIITVINGLFLYFDAVYYLSPIMFSLLFVPFLISALACNLSNRYYCCTLLLFILYTFYFGGMGVLFFGKMPGFHYYNLIFALLPFVLFKRDRLFTLFLLMIINFLLFMYVERYSQITTSTVVFPRELKEFKILNVIGVFIISSVILLFDRKLINSKIKKLVDLTKKLEDDNKSLKQSIITKNKFFSIIAHDLKGPIGNISNFLDLLSDSNSSFTDEELQSSLNALKVSSKNTYSLLENLLNWSRINTGDFIFDPRTSDLCALIKNNIELYRPIAINKNITINFNIHEHIKVLFDFNMINAVIRNLLNNAIKFSYENGVVTVSCFKGNNDITILVKDNGMGMSSQTIGELFRVDVKHYPSKGTNGENGTGLGLIMCKEFIKRHGGVIKVESIEGQGSLFSFTLPC